MGSASNEESRDVLGEIDPEGFSSRFLQEQVVREDHELICCQSQERRGDTHLSRVDCLASPVVGTTVHLPPEIFNVLDIVHRRLHSLSTRRTRGDATYQRSVRKLAHTSRLVLAGKTSASLGRRVLPVLILGPLAALQLQTHLAQRLVAPPRPCSQLVVDAELLTRAEWDDSNGRVTRRGGGRTDAGDE